MMIQEIEKTITENYTYVTLQSGKKEAFISYRHTNGEVNVLCLNASHKAYRGFGKFFNTFEDAINNYKSSDMQHMIKYLQTLVNQREAA